MCLVVGRLRKAMETAIEELLNQTATRLESLEGTRQVSIGASTISKVSKLPFKALLYRESLLWRITELGRTSLESFRNGRPASGILLARAAIESGAALWYLRKKLDEVVRSRAVGDLDDHLMRLVMGSKTNPDLPPSVNVMTFLDHIDKQVPGFRLQYEHLSEFVHPSWAATMGLYSKSSPEKRSTEFGPLYSERPSDENRRAHLGYRAPHVRSGLCVDR